VQPTSPSVNDDQIAEQLKPAEPVIVQGDAAMDRDEIAEAIADYRQAINLAPLSTEPRLKLAEAYLKGGFKEKAIAEAKRALVVSPDNVPVQEFLIHLDTEDSTSEGTVALYQGLVEKNPTDAGAHIGLGDSYWNDDDLARAETEYKIAAHLLPPGDPRANTQLARLYAVQSRYDDAYQALQQVGLEDRYPLAVKIVQMRSDTLMSSLTGGREAFDAGKSSHEEFYDLVKKVSSEAASLSDFIERITPPAEYKVSHLHRKLAVVLIGQEADVLQSFIETSSSDMEEQAEKFEKDAETEMLTAHAGEEKQGLFRQASTP
jgi:tetratricopeptide (TPR) repeat protein